jgi:hypothetical protein
MPPTFVLNLVGELSLEGKDNVKLQCYGLYDFARSICNNLILDGTFANH